MLTKGEQGVVTIAANGISESDALRTAAAVEGDSEHLIAQAIRAKAAEKGVKPAAATQFDSLSGRGVKATVEGEVYYVGGPRLLEAQGLSIPQPLEAAKTEAESAG